MYNRPQYRPQFNCKMPVVQPKCRVIHRYHCKDVCVPCPVHTKVVNHNICRYHYVPQYTCSEENVCQDVHLGKC